MSNCIDCGVDLQNFEIWIDHGPICSDCGTKHGNKEQNYKALLDMLKKCEWLEDKVTINGDFCYICMRLKTAGHLDNCELKQLIERCEKCQ